MQHRMKLKEKAVTLFAAVFATVCSFAGIKYWDNPEFKAFDVGDYVQDGLVLNYDGIRNAGPNADHDPNATTWKNLGSWGSDYDMTRYSLVSSAWAAGGSTGYWTDKGFVTAGSSIFYKVDQPWTLPESYSVQTLTDATSNGQGGNIGYVICPYYDKTVSGGDSDIQDGGLWQKNDWSRFAVGIRKNAFTYKTSLSSSMYLCAGDDMGSRVAVQQDHYQYMTAMLDSKTNAVIFSGIAVPWSEDSNARRGRSAPSSSIWQNGTSGRTKRTFGKGVSIFGHYPRTDELFKGTLNSLRLYSKVLSDEEVAWNRVVDEARYFQRCGAIPITNVVVAVSGISGVADDHFAIDAEGYTFTAPAQRTFEGKRYILGGYTLETWNGFAWVADGEGTHTGNSVTVSDTTAKVRITWQYSRPACEGQLKVYGVDDYVKDELVVHFDGICNQGESVPHSNDATTWVNLGSSGLANDATLNLGAGGGYWTNDGYRFGGNGSKFVLDYAQTWHTNHTVQVLLDAAYADNKAASDGNYFFSASWNKAAGIIRGGDTKKTVWFHTQGLTHTDMPRVENTAAERFTYATAIHNGTEGKACVFTGTEPQTSGEITTGFLSYESSMAEFTSKTSIGGWGGSNGQYLVGKVKNFRYYSRVLTNTELEHNRKVDEYRYFGRYVVTNVLVQSTYSYLDGYEKAGPYEVDGSYTFTAPETVTAPNGITYACDGYTVETQDGIGWAALTSGTGNSYPYNTSAGTVRLTWKWKATSGIRSAADYRFDDLSPAGLALHYDGLLNQGVGEDRSTTSTKWINLGSAGSPMNLSTQRKSGDTSAWGDKGYEYAGNTYFQSDVNTYVWGGSYSAQILADAKYADNKHVSGNYLAASTWNRFGMQVYGDKNLARSNVQGIGDDAMRVTYPTENGIDYMTVIADAAAKVDYAFAGTKIPTGGSATAGYRPYTTQLAPYSNYFRLGGWGGGNNGQGLTGTIFTFRYYDRVLTEEELVRNRNVDSARYFGKLAVTNVVVSISGEETAYKVEGAYTFNAPETVTEKGETVDVAGCYIEELVDGKWANRQWNEGVKEYTYKEATASGKIIRITWLGPRPGLMVIAW